MPRPLKKKLKFDEDTLANLSQEIYNDQFNNRAKLSLLFRQWESKAKTIEDINIIGMQILKIIDLESKNIEQKVTILKVLKEIVKDKKAESIGLKKVADDVEEATKATLTTDTKAQLLELIEANRHKQ